MWRNFRMIQRRTLLGSGLAVTVSSLRGNKSASANREVKKSAYAVWAWGTGDEWWPATHFSFYATTANAAKLRRAKGKIQVRVPYWRRNTPRGFIFDGSLDRGFNGNGYHFGRGRFRVRIPGPRSARVPVRVTMAHTDRRGRVTDFSGEGESGRWIVLEPLGKRR